MNLLQLPLVLLALNAPAGTPGSDRPADPDRVLRRVADRIMAHTTYRLLDGATGQAVDSSGLHTLSPAVRIESDYNDWTYFMGVVLSGMLRSTDATGDRSYREYVLRNFSFIADNLPYFHRQWEELQIPRASYYRYFRMNMLDDCGAMGAALVEALPHGNDPRWRAMVSRIANYVTTQQLRHNDGTLVRPDPRFTTLWADDLYMSVPFLARMGASGGERKYFDDAARQVIRFQHYLRDAGNGLMRHAWFSDTGEQSVACWGRANGWMVMAQTELLAQIPSTHPARDTLVDLFRAHLKALLAVQRPDGFWHQVLTDTVSYTETSCTAMFCYGLARAVRSGWLPRETAASARRAWSAVASRVRPDGQVEGICRGTEVGMTLQFYRDRPTPLNDTRGLGAVLLAATEILLLERDSPHDRR